MLGFTSDYAARISDGGPNGGRTALITSALPMRVTDGDGVKRQTDLELEDRGDAFAPKVPLEPVRIAKSAAGGVALPGGFSIAPVGADVSALRDGDNVVFANVATDTDWVVRADKLGATFHYVLRSEESPQQLRLRVGLPEGASLVKVARDEVEIRQGSRRIGAISPPAAWDADREPVPASIAVDGSDVVLDVPYRDRDVAMPIDVDPTVSAGFFFTYQGADAFDYWQWYDSTGTGYGSTTGKFQRFGGDGYAGRGLYINVPYPGRTFTGYNQFNGAAEKSFWFYRAPGNARIYNTYTAYAVNDVPGSLQLCTFWGIANRDIDAFERSYNEGCTPNYAAHPYRSSVSSPGAGNTWLMGSYAHTSGQHYGTAYFRDSQIDMVDYDDPSRPTIAAPQIPPAYIANPQATLSASSHDDSLGIAKFTFHGPAGWSGNNAVRPTSCPYGPCPQDGYVEIPIDNMPDGQQTVSVTATDAVDHSMTSNQYTLNFDAQNPVLSMSGSLWDARNGAIGASSYGLNVHAEDVGSGTKYIKILVDGELRASTPLGANGKCSTTGSCDLAMSYDSVEFGAGTHEIAIETIDGSHVAPSTLRFNVTWTLDPSRDCSNAATIEGYPSECLAENLPDAPDVEDDAVDLVEPTSFRGVGDPVPSLYRRKVSVTSTQVAASRWGTLRDVPREFSIGSVKHGDFFDVVRSTTGSDPDKRWFAGAARRSNAPTCAWLSGYNRGATTGSPSQTGCTENSQGQGSPNLARKQFLYRANCDTCGNPTRALLKPNRTIVECANVGAQPFRGKNLPASCPAGQEVRRFSSGSNPTLDTGVDWRYITNDKLHRWVLAQDKVHRADGDRVTAGSWVFILRSNFATLPRRGD